MSKTITLNNFDHLMIKGTIYEAKKPSKQPIVYLHGGGLVFGERDDLPKTYIDLFLAAGHSFITLDYLLAPESKLDQIFSTLKETIQTLNLGNDYIIMGRSAGAYLASLLLKSGERPKAFISFYGYNRLDWQEFHYPNAFYNKYPRVLPLDVENLLEKQPLTAGQMDKRFPIYLSARQFATWQTMLLNNLQEATQFSLEKSDLEKFPKTILVHCSEDPDVPYQSSVEASQNIPNNQLITIEATEHDFDRSVTKRNLEIYQQIIAAI